MTYAIILCARSGSERLPNKAIVSYCPDGTPNISQIASRWRGSRRDPVIIAALPDTPQNDELSKLCQKEQLPVYRGSESDVVSRMDGAIKQFVPDAKFIARAMADNPLVDVGLADWRLDTLENTGADGLWYGAEHSKITYAATTDVWSRPAWDKIASESSGSQLEHAGSYYWDNLSKFSIVTFPAPPREYMLPIRTELDTESDLDLFRAVWQAWDDALPAFETVSEYELATVCVPTLWALEWLARHPEVTALNSLVPLKTQSKPLWPKGMGWVCNNCQTRFGSIVAGDLETRCARCGKPKKYFANKPKRVASVA